jgi:hypothetical protein
VYLFVFELNYLDDDEWEPRSETKSKERTMSEVDQNNEPSVDVGPADVPIDTIRNGMRTNNRVFNARYGGILLNGARRNLGQFKVAIDLICCWIDLKNNIACCNSYICAK